MSDLTILPAGLGHGEELPLVPSRPPFTGAALEEPSARLSKVLYLAERNVTSQAEGGLLTADDALRAEAAERHKVLVEGLEPVSRLMALSWLSELATAMRQTDTILDQVQGMVPFAQRHSKVCFTYESLAVAAKWSFFPDYAELNAALRPYHTAHATKVRALLAIMNAPDRIPEAETPRDPARARAQVIAMKAHFAEVARAREAAEALERAPRVLPPPTEEKIARDKAMLAEIRRKTGAPTPPSELKAAK